MSSSVVDGLTVELDGAVLTVTLAAAEGNLMSLNMCDELVQLLRYPPESAHILILQAAGEDFCLGRERTAATPADLPLEVERLVAVNEALASTRLVTVARVHGNAAGFGVGLLALCDVAIATDVAQLCFPEVNIDLAPALVLAWLPQMVGRREAFWLTASGEAVSGERAVRVGLLNESVDGIQALDAAVTRRVDQLLQAKPRVHAEIRSMIRAVEDLSPQQALTLASDRLVLGSMRRSRQS